MQREYSQEEIRALADKNWTEATFQRTINQALKLYKWTFIHIRPAYTGVKWKKGPKAGKPMIITPYDGDAGFPDTVAMKGRAGIAWELKVGKNMASDAQLDWIKLFKANGFDARVCYPSDLESMLQYLREA